MKYKAPQQPGEFWIHRNLVKAKRAGAQPWVVQFRTDKGLLEVFHVEQVSFRGHFESVLDRTPGQPHGYIRGLGTVTEAGGIAFCSTTGVLQ